MKVRPIHQRLWRHYLGYRRTFGVWQSVKNTALLEMLYQRARWL